MADHSDLVSELPKVEKMTTQERLKHAKERRRLQLRMWRQREKELTTKRIKTVQNQNRKTAKRRSDKVHFDPSVMLLEAAARNDIEEVRRLLETGVNADVTNEDGLTALHQCCIDDSEDMMRLLLEFGANVNAEDSERWTPLHAAATCGHLNLVKYLISRSANLLAVNADGNMPYDICEDVKTLDYIEAEMDSRGITQQLIDDTRASTEMKMLADLKWVHDNDDDLDFQDEHGATYLHISSANGYMSVVEFLLDHDAKINISDNDNWQPIHAAACWGHPDIVVVLVQNGADLNAKTKNGETPYDICEDPELKERIQQLKTEMEVIRIAQQTTKLRRSQSSNTRSQSVRRTSIREKSQISRKDARDEAILRLGQPVKLQSNNDGPAEKYDQAVSVNHMDNRKAEEDMVVNVDDIMVIVTNGSPVVNKNGHSVDSNVNQKLPPVDRVNGDSMSRTVTTTEDVPVKDTATARESEMVGPVVSITNNRNGGSGDHRHNSNQSEKGANNLNGSGGVTAVATSRSQSDVKVDLSIVVTVNTPAPAPAQNQNNTLPPQLNHDDIVPGNGLLTMPNLKKERRNRANSVISASSIPEPIANKDDKPFLGKANDRSTTNSSYVSKTPPSPSNKHKFYGNPGEIIGPPEKQGCCALM